MTKNLSPLIIYLVTLLFFIYVFIAFGKIFNIQDNGIQNSKFKNSIRQFADFQHFYLTGWNLNSVVIFLICAVFDEILNTLSVDNKIVNLIRSYIFASIVFPCSILVAVTFWSLFLYDRELVFPTEIGEILPLWLNHAIHTLILIPLIIENCLPKAWNFLTFKATFSGLAIFLLSYTIVYHAIYFYYGIWLYPISYKLSWLQRALFVGILFGMGFSFSKLGIYLQNSRKRVKTH